MMRDPLGLDFVRIKSGDYDFGCEHRSKSIQKMRARISKDFLISTTLVTQKIWIEIMGESSLQSALKNEHGSVKTPLGESIPINYISYIQACEFCKTITAKFGSEYRLPSEVEWEYACRSGTDTQFYWGERYIESEAKEYSHYNFDLPFTLKNVAELKSNPWGLYDMSGLVFEFVGGIYERSTNDPYLKRGTYPSASIDFFPNFPNGDCAVIRGGSIRFDYISMASKYKTLIDVDEPRFDVGFRLAKDI